MVCFNELEEDLKSRFKKRGTKNGPPAWFRPLMGKAWENRVSPFAIGRIIGQTQCNKMIQSYVKGRQTNVTDRDEQ